MACGLEGFRLDFRADGIGIRSLSGRGAGWACTGSFRPAVGAGGGQILAASVAIDNVINVIGSIALGGGDIFVPVLLSSGYRIKIAGYLFRFPAWVYRRLLTGCQFGNLEWVRIKL